MRKTVTALLATLLVFGVALVSADAQPRADDAFLFEGTPDVSIHEVMRDDVIIVPMWGDVWANGRNFGTVDFFLAWHGDTAVTAQLWALWQGVPVQVCVGDIFGTPDGEPIFFGEAVGGGEAEATCHMARTPDHREISLFIAGEDGQWANSIMTNPNWQRTDAEIAFG